jgi:hypothetical protein
MNKPDTLALIERGKREITEDVKSGRVPSTVTSFGDLHDFVDANEYGGLCEEDLANSLSNDDWVAVGNDVQDALDRWIKDGGLAGLSPTPALDPRAQESLAKRVERGEELLQIVWGRKVEGDDRETAAKDAISDILTALLGPAGVAHFNADGNFDRLAINDFRINEAARITSQAVDSYQGDAEDYVTT